MRANATKMTAAEIVDACKALAQSPGLYVTLSGGNPALMRFDGGENNLPAMLHEAGYRTSVETQGSVWREWLAHVTHLTVSPKPPSSGMATEKNRLETATFLNTAEDRVADGERSIKIVCFDEDDYQWARNLILERRFSGWQMFLSAGTTPTATSITRRDLIDDVCTTYGWLCNKVAADPYLTEVRVLPQLHVLAFGAGRGV